MTPTTKPIRSLGIVEAKAILAEMQKRDALLIMEAVRLDLTEAIRQIPDMAAALFARTDAASDRDFVKTRPWFPEVAAEVEDEVIAVIAHSPAGAPCPDDIERLVLGCVLAIMSGANVSRSLWKLEENKPDGQRWVVEGVYDSSIAGARQHRTPGPLMVALPGEIRHALMKELRDGYQPNKVLQEIVFYGLRDPSTGAPHWNLDEIGKLPSLLVSQLAHAVLGLSGLGDAEVSFERSGVDKGRDLNFFLRAVKQSSSDAEEAQKRRDVAVDWLLEKEDVWRNFKGTEKGASLFGIGGRSIKNAFCDVVRKETNREILVTKRLCEIDVPEGSVRQRHEKRNDTSSVSWQFSERKRNNTFDEAVHNEHDVRLAFDAIYGNSPVASRDLNVFVQRHLEKARWGDISGLSDADVVAAKKSIQRHERTILEWLKDNGYRWFPEERRSIDPTGHARTVTCCATKASSALPHSPEVYSQRCLVCAFWRQPCPKCAADH